MVRVSVPREWLMRAAAVCVAMFCVTGCSAQSAGAPSCVAPEATASPDTGTPTETITVAGQYWQPCNDTNHSFEDAWPTVSVEWTQSGEVVTLSSIPIEDGAFSGEVAIPVDATPGHAALRITAGYAEIELPITVPAP